LAVGAVYGVLGALGGLLLGLIPETILVLMVLGCLFGAWMGARQEADPAPPAISTSDRNPTANGRRSPQS
jgi:uncharacterized protein involved in cysteine biosynthesis